jgi:phospholipid-binding lipoprotein MlaA
MNRIITTLSALLLIQLIVVNKTYSAEDEVKDCFEKLNRVTFALNMGLDKVIFEPLAKGYRKLPSPVRTGTDNALSNLSNLITIPNNILQGDFGSAANNSARLVINTTLGIAGIFDPANSFGFEKRTKEDFGQSLGVMGVGEGCYLVLPVLGPTTIRDTVGSLIAMNGGDVWHNITVRDDEEYVKEFKESDYWASRVTSGVDFRAKNLEAFDAMEKNSVDLYATVRSLYLQDRKRKIKNSQSKTEAMEDGDWDTLEKL